MAGVYKNRIRHRNRGLGYTNVDQVELKFLKFPKKWI
jgi:hypothetical protein